MPRKPDITETDADPDVEPDPDETPEADAEIAVPVDPSQVVYPVGVYVGEGAERAWNGGTEYVVDPETGRITGPA